MSDQAKRRVGEAVARWVQDGMTLGLGTGSTAAQAIRALGSRIKNEGLKVRGVPTSFFSEGLARECKVPLTTLDVVSEIDLAFDGADEVDPLLNLIKGRGAAQTREKVVAASSRRFVVLVDSGKLVDRLGTRMPVPVEVVPMACAPVMRSLTDMGAECRLRMGQRKDGPVVSDQGMWIVDARFDGIDNPNDLARAISCTPGVVDHGIFVQMASDVLVGREDGSIEHLVRARVPRLREGGRRE